MVLRKRVLVADDHKIVLEGIRNLLEPKYDLVATVEDGRALVEKATELDPDLIVADISMPRLNGLDVLRQLKRQGSRAKFIVLTMHLDATYAARALDAGASGYVLKHSASSELLKAIGQALLGRTYVTPLIDAEALRSQRGTRKRRRDPLANLTPRQREVLQLVAEGHSARQIAELLSISPRTAEFHKYRLMDELGVRTNAELTQFAVKHGIVSP